MKSPLRLVDNEGGGPRMNKAVVLLSGRVNSLVAAAAVRIIIGTSEDHSTSKIPISHLYPDYRREFLQSFNLVLQYGKTRDQELAIEAPLLELSRAEVVKLGDLMGVPFEHTWSCFAN